MLDADPGFELSLLLESKFVICYCKPVSRYLLSQYI